MTERNPKGIHFHKVRTGQRRGYKIWSWRLHREDDTLRWFGFTWQEGNGRWHIELEGAASFRSFGSRKGAARALEKWKETGVKPAPDLTSILKHLDS